jgi:TetR/AcrR family transcriptional regulator, mexJK operon transcriptional repressor
MTATDQSIRRGRKFEQVLEGARKVFLRDGFSAANVDDIAREAGVSKATLYSYFPEKRLMFSEMMRLECLRQAETAIAEINLDQPIERVLFDAACHAIEMMTSDFSIRIFRICVAEAERFPELGTAFYESGPMMARAQLMFHLGQVVAEGKLQIEDLEIAAFQFSELCKVWLFDRALFTPATHPTPAERDRVARAAVRMFMASYAPR